MEFTGSSKSSVYPNGEMRLTGLPVARGVAVGQIVPLHGNKQQFFRVEIADGRVDEEKRRLELAFARSSRQLARLLKENEDSRSRSNILAAHIAILEDPSFRSKIENIIEEEHVNAEWAISLVGDEYVSRFKSLPDEHFRERYLDIEDVVERLLVSFSKRSGSARQIPAGAIIAAEELRPSTLVDLGANQIAGCITEHGGWTSHTFILAREMGLPAVTGIPNLLRLIESGQTVVIDGFHGEVIIDPAPQTVEKYRNGQASQPAVAPVPRDETPRPLQTIDGRKVTVRVNADSVKSVRRARALGAEGVGLFRTESLFNRFNGFPTERQQYESFLKLGDAAGDAGVKVRTFDIGARQSVIGIATREKNPALGLRGIRLALEDTVHLRAQFRALLRASAEGRIDVILPMVAGLKELREARAIFEEERDGLAKDGIRTGEPNFGVMIEVPSAVLIVDRILAEVDFLCLGTNDLVQYLLATDRDNEGVAEWFRTLHPAVIMAISQVLDAGKSAGKPVIVCGEMAGSPFYTPMLVGLGAVEFSMNLNSIERVMRLIRGIAYEEVLALVKALRELSTAEEIESLIMQTIREKWLHLFPPDFLSLRKI